MKRRFLLNTLLCGISILLLSSCIDTHKKNTPSVADVKKTSTNIADEQYLNSLRDNLTAANNTNDKTLRERQQRQEEEKANAKIQNNTQKEAPYGYNEWGEPYASLDDKKFDKALDDFNEARLGYMSALDSRDVWGAAYYHNLMKLKIEDCLYYAKITGSSPEIIKKLKEYERTVDNLPY